MVSGKFLSKAAAFAFAGLISTTVGAQTLVPATTVPTLQPLPLAISGRVEAMPAPLHVQGFGEDQYQAQWPGTVYRGAFRGREVYLRIGPNHEILHVVVDGQAPLILPKPEVGVYRLSGLRDARHTVEVMVATESQDAPNTFGGLGVPKGEQVLRAAKQARQIEFIGDSHTVGFGNTSSKQTCTPDEIWASTDDTQAFGALVARHYNADYQVNAISGRGIVRNYNGFAGATLPEAYPYVLFDKKRAYHDAAWKPQVIVIALGTNDFSTALNPGERWKTRDALHADYEATYLHFLQQLHAANPGAYIVLWATGMAHGEIEAEVRKVMAQAKAQGVNHLTFVPFDHLQMSGCAGHPSLPDEKTIGEGLQQAIDAEPNVW